MSDLKPNPGTAKNVEEYTSDIFASNLNWAQRMTQRFPQYFPDPKDPQAPKILWVGCSDSRVQESDATTSLPGNIFLHRNIANQFHLNDDNALSVLAYALKELAVQHIAIVGHRHCGGAITAMKEAALPVLPGQSNDPNDALTRWLTPLVDHVRKLALPEDQETALDVVIEENVKVQVNNLTQLDSFVRKSAKAKPVWVHGWVYDFSTGSIKDLEITKVLGAHK
ncbi:carbonic anhydrase [Gyrodon lividus]|nr:carbonic anhydrase [Gyrodon lividus]